MIHEGKHYGTGALPSPKDERDYQWHEVAHGSAPFNWSTGYDVETLMPVVPTKDQGQSGSCGGQAWSYYSAAIEALYTKSFEERSARFVYSQTFVPGGGSDGRTNCDLVKSKGDARETVFTSYENGAAPSEAFMEKHSDITSAVLTDAMKGMTLSYAMVPNGIDGVAQAIRDSGGVVIGIRGSNNGTWLSPNPKKPANNLSAGEYWYHWLYAGKARLNNGVKQIGVHNSWGLDVGEKGWQWIDADYFDGVNIWEVWSMVFNPNGVLPIFHHTFNVDLELGQTSAEVQALQTALQTDGDFPATVAPTQYFGTITQTAVKKFQDKYNVAHSGDAGYGRCGPKTRAQLNKIFG